MPCTRALRDRWVSVAPSTHMGHARNRPHRLAEKLLQIRKGLGLSQREIAKRLGEQAGVKISYKNISKYEHDRSVPPMEIVLAYARIANVTMNEIVDDEVELSDLRAL